MVPILGIIFLNALICAGIAIYFYAKTFNGNIIAEHDKWGALGDFFGGVLNPAFSLLALLALLLTIILQSKELSLATAEYTKSTQALVDQSNSMKKQSFEQTFFQLLIAHNQIVNGIDLKKNGLVTTTGRDCFRVFYDRLQNLYESRSKKSNNTDDLEFEIIGKNHDELETTNANYNNNSTTAGLTFKVVLSLSRALNRSPKDNG